jgi:hypothetical protein
MSLKADDQILVEDSIFKNNSSMGYGGALWLERSAFLLVNNVFVGNTSTVDGGAIGVNEGPGIFLNCDFVQNHSDEFGGAIWTANIAEKVFSNCIFWENTASSAAYSHIMGGSDDSTIRFSLMGGSGAPATWINVDAIDGGDNIDGDPLFVDGSDGGDGWDLNLTGSSPALEEGDNVVFTEAGLESHLSVDFNEDADYDDGIDLNLDGDTSDTISDFYDISGNARLNSVSVDIGAYEY